MNIDLYQMLMNRFNTMPCYDKEIPELTPIDLLQLIHNEAYVNNQPVFFISHENTIEINWDLILCTSTDDAKIFDILKRTLDFIFEIKPQPIALKQVILNENRCFLPSFYIGEEITQVIEWTPLYIVDGQVFLHLTQGLLAGPFLTMMLGEEDITKVPL